MSTRQTESQFFAVFGSEDVVSGYRAVGFQVNVCRNRSEFEEAFERARTAGAVLCLVEEGLFLAARERISAFREKPLPVIIPFSARDGLAALDRQIREIRLRATGTDIQER